MMVQKFVENPYYQYFCGNEYFDQLNADTTVEEKAISFQSLIFHVVIWESLDELPCPFSIYSVFYWTC
jgi:hypothetical protein